MEFACFISDFNSIKVRLKPATDVVFPAIANYFNSIKVRLKPKE